MLTRSGLWLAFAALCLLAHAAHARQWTDLQGRKIDATFARVEGNLVVLQQGLKVLKVPLASLSADDQDFIRKQTEKRRPGGKPASDPATPAAPAGGALTAERTWTDSQGRTTRGRFEQMVGGSTVQLNINGQPTFLQLSRLSAADQQFLRDQGAIPADPVAAVPGFPAPPNVPGIPDIPKPGLPNIPRFERPAIVPPVYPPGGASAGVQLEGPRWWHSRDKVVFAALQRIDFRGVQLVRDHAPVRISFDDLAASDAAHALVFPSREGQAAFVEKVRSTNPSAFAGTSPQQAASPGLPESDLMMSESREWHVGFETLQGQLVEVQSDHIRISDSSPAGKRLALSELFAGDREWLLAFLARHAAEPLAAKVREAGDAAQAPFGLVRTESETRQWNVRGQELEAQIVMMGREGIELRDTTGKHHRKAYKAMSDAERSYLGKFAQGKPELASVQGWIASAANPQSQPSFPSPPSPPSGPPPGFRPGGPDFGPRFEPQPTPFQPPQLQPQPVPSGPSGMVGECGKCKRIVSGNIKPGDRCPHCGVTFDVVENADGSKSYSSAYVVGQWFGIAVFAIAVIFGIARRFA